MTEQTTPEQQWDLQPSMEEIMRWSWEGGCYTTDGCWVEEDGTCEHGHRSWMLVMGLI